MDDVKSFDIWPRETGITDLPATIDRLALPSMTSLRQEWELKKQELLDKGALEDFSNQLQREWAIETGQIENLYDIERGVTLSLIEQGFQSSILERGSTDKDPEYVLALINDQKNALEGLFSFVKQERTLSTSYIKELHAAMTRSQPTTEARDSLGNKVEVPLLQGEWKTQPNFPVRNGKQYMYCPPDQTASEMDRLVQMHLEHVSRDIPPEIAAAWLHHRFTQIHPFQDGNGRVARALASLVLIRGEMFPFVVPRSDKDLYLDTLEAADEENLRPFILFLARRQQAELVRATKVTAKHSKKSDSLEEAISSVLPLLSHQEEVKNQIIIRRENLAIDTAFKTIQTKAAEIKKILSSHGIKAEILSSANWQYFTEKDVKLHFNAISVSNLPNEAMFGMPSLAKLITIDSQIRIYYLVVVRRYSDKLENELRVQVLLGFKNKTFLPSKNLFRISLDFDQIDQGSLDSWATETITSSFDIVRSQLASD